VVDHPKLAHLPDPTAEAGQRVVRDGATRQLLDPPAALAHQVGVMPGELLTQLIPEAATACVYGPQESGRYQQVDSSVDRYPVDALLGHSIVNLLDRQRAFARADCLQDGATWTGQPVTLSGEQVMKRDPRSNRWRGHVRPPCEVSAN
jgi:hypothetical protein